MVWNFSNKENIYRDERDCKKNEFSVESRECDVIRDR
jgi:hypothetical protein